MNTPPRKKRWSPLFDPNRAPPAGNYSGTIGDPEYASRLGRLLAEFVHIEGLMSTVLAVLLGAHDSTQAGFVLRAIKSPKGRIDVMRELLELAPQNRDLPEEYDAIIREFAAINRQRNIYAHGLWWTNNKDGSVYLAEENDDGLGFQNSRPATIVELDTLMLRMAALIKAIFEGPLMELRRRASHQSHLERTAPPRP